MGQIALVNHSPTLMTDDQGTLMARFVTVGLKHLAQAWGQIAWSCSYVPSVDRAPTAAKLLHLFPNPDVANALGWHDVGQDGIAFGKVFLEPTLQNGGSIIASGATMDSNSVLQTAGHEASELVLDELVGSWEVMPDGVTLLAKESSDPCEDRSKKVKLTTGESAWCSDFVYPEYFARVAPRGQLTWCSSLTEPFSMTEGGYQIQWSTRGSEHQVFPSLVHGHGPGVGTTVEQGADGLRIVWGPNVPEWKKALKRHRLSRTAHKARLHVG